MKKLNTLVLVTVLAAGTLSAEAQITLDGIINATEIGAAAAGKYTSLGAFSPLHVSNAGFGQAGLLRMYGANKRLSSVQAKALRNISD